MALDPNGKNQDKPMRRGMVRQTDIERELGGGGGQDEMA